jgi:hypothetical protein
VQFDLLSKFKVKALFIRLLASKDRGDRGRSETVIATILDHLFVSSSLGRRLSRCDGTHILLLGGGHSWRSITLIQNTTIDSCTIRVLVGVMN